MEGVFGRNDLDFGLNIVALRNTIATSRFP